MTHMSEPGRVIPVACGQIEVGDLVKTYAGDVDCPRCLGRNPEEMAKRILRLEMMVKEATTQTRQTLP